MRVIVTRLIRACHICRRRSAETERERLLMNNLKKRNNNGSLGLSVWSIVGGAVLVATAFLVAKNFADIRRYIKIEMM
jgi:hypothetical protein